MTIDTDADTDTDAAGEADTTELVLWPIGVPPFSARGLTQTLEPIDAAATLRRTVNGSLLDLSVDEFRKYRSQITGRDQQSPAIDGVWPGAALTVDCLVELSYRTIGGTAKRSVVEGSSRTEGDFTFYRPRLEMRVAAFSTEKDEYGADVSWTLNLEEI